MIRISPIAKIKTPPINSIPFIVKPAINNPPATNINPIAHILTRLRFRVSHDDRATNSTSIVELILKIHSKEITCPRALVVSILSGRYCAIFVVSDQSETKLGSVSKNCIWLIVKPVINSRKTITCGRKRLRKVECSICLI